MARSSSNKQSTSAPPADAVARSARATVVQKQPRVVLSPTSAFERRVAQHLANQAHVAAVNAHLARERAAKDAAAATMTTIDAAPLESSDTGEKSTFTKKKAKGKGSKEPNSGNNNEPKAASGGKKKNKKPSAAEKKKTPVVDKTAGGEEVENKISSVVEEGGGDEDAGKKIASDVEKPAEEKKAEDKMASGVEDPAEGKIG
jgi:hypothetical protein